MKKLFLTLAAVLFTLQALAQGPKYVFFFIGDGMGVNIINYTQYYKAAVNGNHGTELLNFAEFPVCGIATTWCSDREVTDSAASGTALSTGSKTNYRSLGNDPEGKPLESIAEKARDAGRKVAVITTVGVNHATPGAFFAHQDSRNSYDAISKDLIKAGFDFYAGSEIIRGKKEAKIEGFNPRKEITDAGYTFAASRNDFLEKYKGADKMIMIPDKEHQVTYAIDRPLAEGSPLSLTEMLTSATEFLMKDGCPQGFFLMAEGGRIDNATHGNDAATAVQEILDMEDAIAYAIEFYNQHPDETAILVTSDHDTGGSAIFPKNKEVIKYLDYQKCSSGKMTSILKKELEKCSYKMGWDDMKAFISEYTGLWSLISVKPEDAKALEELYQNTIAKAATGNVSDEWGYNETAAIVYKAIEILDKYAGITWTTSSHSGSFVPVYYIGPKPELFSQMNDNALLGQRLAEVMF